MENTVRHNPGSFLDFFNLLRDKDFAVSYFGDFSADIKNAILADIRRKLDLLENRTLLKKRIFSVADESFDNIINYARNSGQLNYQSLFSLFRERAEYVLTIGNRVDGSHKQLLEEKVRAVAVMNADELASEYKQAMAAPLPDDAQGAGLGILLMAIRSGNKIEHLFERQADGNYFFILMIRIS